MSEPIHPTQAGIRGYKDHGCRCEGCIAAHAQARAKARAYDQARRGPATALGAVDLDWSLVSHLKPGHNVKKRS